MRHPSLPFLLLPLLLGNQPAVAAPAPALAEEIIVTAPRTMAPLEVVTDPGKPRQPLPAHDGADYLKTVPGFSVIRKGGTDGDPLFRGMSGSRINILSDGAMLLGGCGSRMDPPTAYVFPQNYDRIRILKGPQSVLYGAGGSAATVLFERDPFDYREDGNHLNVSALTASWSRRDLAMDALAGNALGYVRLQGSDGQADDYQSGSGDDVHSEYRRWNAGATIGFTPRESTLIELTGNRSDGQAAYADRSMDGVKFDREALTLRVRESDLSARIHEVDIELAYGNVDHVMDNYKLRDFTPSMMMPTPMVSNPERETMAARLAITMDIATGLIGILGADGHDDTHATRSSMNQSAMPYQELDRITDGHFEQRGAFAEFTLEMTPGSQWAWGLRLDRWQVEDDRATVRVGMMSVPNPTANERDQDWLTSGYLRYEQTLDGFAELGEGEAVAFAGLGYAERTADYWERFGNSNQSPDSTSAFFTDPERTAQLDTGILYRTAGSRFSASVFAANINDYILTDTRVTGKPMNTVVSRNIDARTFGGELEHAIELRPGLTLESSLAYTRGENRTDDRSLAQMPPLEARIALTRSAGRYSYGGLLRWVGDQDRADPGRGNVVGQDIGESDNFTIVSLNGSYQLSDAVDLAAGIDNLFDQTYLEHLSRAGAMVAGFVQTERVPEPGRTLWLKLDARF